MASHRILISEIKKLKSTYSIEPDFNSIINNVQLLKNESDIGLIRKSVDLEQESDGSVSATSIKAYNILKASQTEFQLSIFRILGTAVTATLLSNVVATVFAFITLIGLFLEKSKLKLNQQDAKILFVIYNLGSSCHISTIQSKYSTLFNEKLENEKIEKSISKLVDIKTIELDADEVNIIETIYLQR